MPDYLSLKKVLRDAKARVDEAELEARADLRLLIATKRFWLVVLAVALFFSYLYIQGRISW